LQLQTNANALNNNNTKQTKQREEENLQSLETMAATVSSPWSKPGAWALDAEEHEAELQQQDSQPKQEPADFPSLAAAAADAKTASKKKKKNKGTTISLSMLQTGAYTRPELNTASLPKGPRERSAEELDQMRNGGGGGGFRSYGDSSSSRWGREAGGGRDSNFRDSSREREVMPREPLGPSRADEADDWSKGKRSTVGAVASGDGFERRGRERGSSFFEGHSKADESDSWVSNRTPPAVSSEPRRFGGGGGYERRGSFDSLSRDRGNADSESWGRKREESNGVGNVGSARPRLVLQPRTSPAPVVVIAASNEKEKEKEKETEQLVVVPRPKGLNPFGSARPREEVLAEKGKDWKEIDEKLETMKVKGGEDDKMERADKGSRWSFGRVGAEEGMEKSWRKVVADSVNDDSSREPQSSESVENGHADSTSHVEAATAEENSDAPAAAAVEN
ncbi:Eukaryotic translation initiation factor 4B3, partial [Linum grandiflorum]